MARENLGCMVPLRSVVRSADEATDTKDSLGGAEADRSILCDSDGELAGSNLIDGNPDVSSMIESVRGLADIRRKGCGVPLVFRLSRAGTPDELSTART